jgi:hypothetical protein
LRLDQKSRAAAFGVTVMLGFDPARMSDTMPARDRLVLPLARLAIGLLLLGAVIAGLMC